MAEPNESPIPFEKRQEILSHTGRIHVALSELLVTYPLIRLNRYLPDGLLPFSRQLIERAIAEELQDPVSGAQLRDKTVEAWDQDLRAFATVLLVTYVDEDSWAMEAKEKAIPNQRVEQLYLSGAIQESTSSPPRSRS